jgi:hypothetical protein
VPNDVVDAITIERGGSTNRLESARRQSDPRQRNQPGDDGNGRLFNDSPVFTSRREAADGWMILQLLRLLIARHDFLHHCALHLPRGEAKDKNDELVQDPGNNTRSAV